MNTTTATKPDICRRCKGKGWGDWAPENGRCHRCLGTGRESTAHRLAAKAAFDRRIAEEYEEAYVTLEATSAREARWQAALAFDALPEVNSATEIEPGLWVVTYQMHPDWAPPSAWTD